MELHTIFEQETDRKLRSIKHGPIFDVYESVIGENSFRVESFREGLWGLFTGLL